jgi:transposase-like protein
LTTKILSREEKNQLIDLWRQSGKTKKAFAEEYGIKAGTFTDWVRRPNRSKKSTKPRRFIEITPSSVSRIFAEVHFSGGHKVIFYEPISAELFSRLIK